MYTSNLKKIKIYQAENAPVESTITWYSLVLLDQNYTALKLEFETSLKMNDSQCTSKRFSNGWILKLGNRFLMIWIILRILTQNFPKNQDFIDSRINFKLSVSLYQVFIILVLIIRNMRSHASNKSGSTKTNGSKMGKLSLQVSLIRRDLNSPIKLGWHTRI